MNQGTPPLRFDLVNVGLATAVVILVLAAFQFLSMIQGIVVLLLLAVILATAIEPIVLYLRRSGLRRGYSVVLIYLSIVTAVSVFLVLLAEAVGAQLIALVSSLPSIVQQLGALAASLPRGPLRDLALAALASLNPGELRPALSALVTTGTLSGLLFATLGVLEVIFAIVTVLVLAYFWIAERLAIRGLALRLIDPSRRNQALAIWENVEAKLGDWARGQLLLMFAVGVLQGIGYSILGLQFALLLAVYAGLVEIVPIIGPYLGAIPAILIALTQGPMTAVLVLGFTVVINLLEANILVPRIMQTAVGLSPLTVILALLIGAAVYGIIGAFLAVPIAAAIQAILTELMAPPGEPPSPRRPQAPSSAD